MCKVGDEESPRGKEQAGEDRAGDHAKKKLFRDFPNAFWNARRPAKYKRRQAPSTKSMRLAASSHAAPLHTPAGHLLS
jgi:hypothetical protein